MPSELGGTASRLPSAPSVPGWPESDLDDPVADLPVKLGDTIAGRYVVLGVLGTGGMGIVCHGRHIELEQAVAIKFLRRRFTQDRTVTARFLEEARAAAALRTEHVVRVMDVGQTETSAPYYVMEQLEGVDLETLLVREGPLRIARAIDYVRQACAALHEAHALGIAHRDIKPENLFLASRGEDRAVLKVVDFGIAKRLDPARAKVVTGPQENVGSPCYMSPEQMWTPRSIDTRTDVWSLGVVLYQLLTGALPFDGETVSDVFTKVASAEYTPMSALRPGVDPYLEAIVRRCLEKSLDARYASVVALSRDLDQYEATVLRATDPSRKVAPSPPPPRTRSDAPLSGPIRRIPVDPGSQSTRGGWWVVALSSLALLGFIGLRKAPASPLGRTASRAVEIGARVAEGALGRDRPVLGAALDEPLRPASRAYVVEPLGTVLVGGGESPALLAEPEHASELAAQTGGPLSTLADRKERTYRRYLQRHGWRPIREVLEEMSGGNGTP